LRAAARTFGQGLPQQGSAAENRPTPQRKVNRVDIFLQQIINGLTLGSVYALVALGYTMVYGIIGLINFAHGEVVMIGAMVSLSVITALLGAHAPLPAFAIIAAGLAVAIIVCMVLAYGMEKIAYRPLRKAPRLAPLITAIGMSFILENIMQYWRGPSPVPFPQVIPNPSFALGAVQIQTKQIMVVLLAVVLMFALQAFVYNTRLGKAMRATAQDKDAAQLMGIDINTTIALTFLIGSALAGAAGFVSGVYYGSTWFFNGFAAGLKAFTAAVLGGIGNLAGAMLGGFLIGLIEAMTTQFIGDQWSNVMVFSILVLVLIFRPSGLLGESLPNKV